MTLVIIGASAGLGRALAEAGAESGHDLVLVARDRRDLDAIAADLTIRFGVTVAPVAVDLSDAGRAVPAILDVAARFGGVRALLLPVGLADDDDTGALPAEQVDVLMRVNLTSLIHLTQGFAPVLQAQGSGTIVGFGSIAAARGRSGNMVYASAKRALMSWFESLRHRLWRDGVRVQFYVPGYLATNMSFGRATPLPAASPDTLARIVLRRLDRDFGVAYFPRYWQLLTLALRLLPWVLYRRLRF